MPAYLVELDQNNGGRTLYSGANACVVFAADAAAAKEVCQSRFPGANATWAADSTVTEVVAGADFDGWTFTATVTGEDTNATFVKVGDATDNLIDEIGAAMVILINAHADIAGAAYDASGQVLKVAETTDNIGDHSLSLTIVPPGGDSSIDELVGTVVDGGIVAAVLSVVLPADAAVIPTVLRAVKIAE